MGLVISEGSFKAIKAAYHLIRLAMVSSKIIVSFQ